MLPAEITAGSLFTGIGGFDLALERAGYVCEWQSETDKAAAALLERRFPGVKNLGDVRNVGAITAKPVDFICGGFPCQDLSIAGQRKGLAGERSGLWYEFARVIEELKPGWVLIENVPGLLSSNGGRDMEAIVRTLVKFGYGVAWRVLDAQYFGLAQRRKRVFIVGSLRNGRAAEILFERESGPGDTAPSRENAERVAGSIDRKSASSNRGRQANELDFIIPINTQISTRGNKLGERTGFGIGEDGDPSYTLQENHHHAIFYGGNNTSGPIDVITAVNASGSRRYDFESETFVIETANTQSNQNEDFIPTLDTNGKMYSGVRRLTPLECERLQGFPDGWTEGQSDSARYRQLGNAVAVPVVEWIVKRIKTAQLQIRMDI